MKTMIPGDKETGSEGSADTPVRSVGEHIERGHAARVAEGVSVPSSAVRDHITTWVSSTLANRAVVTKLPDTDGFCGKVKGLPSIYTCSGHEAGVLQTLRATLECYAEMKMARGEPLPNWTTARIEVPSETVALVRVSRLRKLILARGEAWGVKREKLPAHIIGALLADFDQLITSHATAMPSAT